MSPRKISGGVDVRTVLAVLDYFDVYHHVEDTPRAPRALMMPAPHTEMLIDIVKSTPWLFLDEISAELETRCHVKYLPGDVPHRTTARRGAALPVLLGTLEDPDETVAAGLRG